MALPNDREVYRRFIAYRLHFSGRFDASTRQLPKVNRDRFEPDSKMIVFLNRIIHLYGEEYALAMVANLARKTSFWLTELMDSTSVSNFMSARAYLDQFTYQTTQMISGLDLTKPDDMEKLYAKYRKGLVPIELMAVAQSALNITDFLQNGDPTREEDIDLIRKYAKVFPDRRYKFMMIAMKEAKNISGVCERATIRV